jgi:hypothetical protein
MDLVASLCEAQLSHPESFVYQAALNALEAAAAADASDVLPRLSRLLLPDMSAGSSTRSTRMADDPIIRDVLDARTATASESKSQTKGIGAATLRPASDVNPPHEPGMENDAELDVAVVRRLKAAQAICQAVRSLGETLPAHAEAVMGALLVGACDKEPAVRTSCLACLADVAATLRFGLHPWAVELLQCVLAAVEGETDHAARQAACYLLSLLLQSLGAEALTVLPAQMLARVYRMLKHLRDVGPADERLEAHVRTALEHLGALGDALVRGSSARDPTDERGIEAATNVLRRKPSPRTRPLIQELEQLTVRMP